jgi:hypothetical protein
MFMYSDSLFDQYLKNYDVVNLARREFPTALGLSPMATHRINAFWIAPSVGQFACATPISLALRSDVAQSHIDLSQPESELGDS